MNRIKGSMPITHSGEGENGDEAREMVAVKASLRGWRDGTMHVPVSTPFPVPSH